MSKSLSQIFSEAVVKRNAYLQITELNSGLTKSKMSILNLITYVQAVLIFAYQTILDVFEVDIANLIANRINGTAPWYAAMALKFQFNNTTNSGDTLIFDDEKLKIRYEKVDTSHLIIAKSAFQKNDNGDGIILKVCKVNTDSNELSNGINYTQLTSGELTAFKNYIDQIKFIGAVVQSMSIPGDIIAVKNCMVTYDDQYITEEQVMDSIQKALIKFTSTLDYNAYIYYQSIIDAIFEVDNVVDVTPTQESGSVLVMVKQYNATSRKYDEEFALTQARRAKAGYIRFLDEDGNSTIKKEEAFIQFKKKSSIIQSESAQ